MGFKLLVLKHYLEDTDIIQVISHDGWAYLVMLIKYLCMLVITFVVYKLITYYMIEGVYLDWFFALIGIVVYGSFVISFMDIYLDSIVLTHRGLIIFQWDGLLKNRTETINRAQVSSVYEDQSGILDIMLNKGDLIIKRQDEQYLFSDVHEPGAQANLIMQTRADMINDDDEEDVDPDKFDVLVETLGDVILDYVKRSKKDKDKNLYY